MSSGHPLLCLARHDARLYHLKQQLASLPRRLAELDQERERLEREQREAEARHAQAELAQRKLETELREFRDKRAKSEARLATLTSTEQYQALVKEMAVQSQRIDALESSILEAMERCEEMSRQRDVEKARVTQALEGLEAQRTQLGADLGTARADVPRETAARDAAAATVDPQTRALYERILRSKGDAALSLVRGQVCGICKAVQPPQVVQALRQQRGILTCQMCGRILVWDPESE